MRAQKNFLIAIICLLLGFIATSLPAQQAPDEFPVAGAGSGARLVITSISGPATAFHNETISVVYYVKNQGTAPSSAYYVDLYLSTDQTIDPAAERLLRNVKFSTGLAPGEGRKATAMVLVPNNGLSGNYYYGAVVANSNKKASSKQVEIVRYTADDSDTVTDHKSGLVWQKTDDGELRNWDVANQYCGDLELGGRVDWRLPQIDELQTIVDHSRSNPAIDLLFECRSNLYWSASTSAENADFAWHVSFSNGYLYWDLKSRYNYVRCVRGGP